MRDFNFATADNIVISYKQVTNNHYYWEWIVKTDKNVFYKIKSTADLNGIFNTYKTTIYTLKSSNILYIINDKKHLSASLSGKIKEITKQEALEYLVGGLLC